MEWLRAAIEIFLFFLVFYFIIRSLEGTQGEGIIVGYVFLFILFFAVLMVIARYFSLEVVEYFLSYSLNIYLFAIVVVFQQEVRTGLIRLGQLFFGRILDRDQRREKDIVEAVTTLCSHKIGALIAIEKNVGLKNYLEKGIRLDATVSKELLCSIFWPGNPLHDGAVIIQGNQVTAASCILPLSDKSLASFLGTRHRAALGISDVTDAIVIAVSEERGEATLCYEGKMIQNISSSKLEQFIRNVFLDTEFSFKTFGEKIREKTKKMPVVVPTTETERGELE